MTSNDERTHPADADPMTPGHDQPAAETTGPELRTLDPDRDDVERNAAGGGWEGANEVIENDFETEQLRREAPLDEQRENQR